MSHPVYTTRDGSTSSVRYAFLSVLCWCLDSDINLILSITHDFHLSRHSFIVTRGITSTPPLRRNLCTEPSTHPTYFPTPLWNLYTHACPLDVFLVYRSSGASSSLDSQEPDLCLRLLLQPFGRLEPSRVQYGRHFTLRCLCKGRCSSSSLYRRMFILGFKVVHDYAESTHSEVLSSLLCGNSLVSRSTPRNGPFLVT